MAAVATQAAELDGTWPLASLVRVAESAPPDAPVSGTDTATWSVRGESRPVRGSAPQTWLHLHARASMSLVCQRCLGPVPVALEVDRSFLFVAGEDEAARLDDDTDDDVLALTAAFDLRDLVEDELLLAMPLVPRHAVCPEPLVAPVDALVDVEPANPFAALAALKRDPRPN